MRVANIRNVWVVGVLTCVFSAFIVGPLLVLVPCSFNDGTMLEWPRAFSVRWYKAVLQDQAWLSALSGSLLLAGSVAAVSTLIGSALSSYVMESRPFRKNLTRLFFLSPLAIPLISLAVALYVCLIKIGLVDTFIGLVCAHCVLCVPVAFGVLSASLRRRGVPLEAAAVNLGASRLQTWAFVTLPSVKRAVWAAFLLCFAVSFNEVVITILLTDLEFITVSKKMWDGIRFEISPALAVASVLVSLIAISIVVVFASLIRDVLGGSESAGAV